MIFHVCAVTQGDRAGIMEYLDGPVTTSGPLSESTIGEIRVLFQQKLKTENVALLSVTLLDPTIIPISHSAHPSGQM